MCTRGALGFEARRSRRYPLSLATILLAPALALALRGGIDLNFESYPPLIAAAVLTALAMFAVFWRFDPQFRGDVNQFATIAIFVLVYSYGVLAFADVVLDPSKTHVMWTSDFGDIRPYRLKRHMGHLHFGKFPVPAFPFFDVLVAKAHCQSARTSWQDDQPYALQHFKQRESNPSTAFAFSDTDWTVQITFRRRGIGA
jgi:hypothetical protein